MAWLLGIIGAVILGAAGNLAYELAKHQTLRLPRVLRLRRDLPADVRSFDSITLGLYPMVTWSRKRRLDEKKIRMSYVGRRPGDHIFDRPTRKEITNVIRGGASPDGVHPWITELSPVVAAEVWRFRGAL